MQLLHQQLRFSATDLSTFISCHRATELDKLLVHGDIEKPAFTDPYVETIQELGRKHEDKYIAYLRQQGRDVVDLRDIEGDDNLERTINAMKAGAEIIIQAKFDDGTWMGYADLLYRRDMPDGQKSNWGDWYYDIGDAKLASETKGGTMLQLCVYAELLEKVQGCPPHHLYVIKPGEPFEEEVFLHSHFAAYYRFMRNRFMEAVKANP